jgi:hypothetical protein
MENGTKVLMAVTKTVEIIISNLGDLFESFFTHQQHNIVILFVLYELMTQIQHM